MTKGTCDIEEGGRRCGRAVHVFHYGNSRSQQAEGADVCARHRQTRRTVDQRRRAADKARVTRKENGK